MYNTYGEHGNAELVGKYGFAVSANPFNAVHLDRQDLVSIAASIMGERPVRRRCRFLSTHRSDIPGCPDPSG